MVIQDMMLEFSTIWDWLIFWMLYLWNSAKKALGLKTKEPNTPAAGERFPEITGGDISSCQESYKELEDHSYATPPYQRITVSAEELVSSSKQGWLISELLISKSPIPKPLKLLEVRGEVVPGWVSVDIAKPDHEINCCIPIPDNLRGEFDRYLAINYSDSDFNKIQNYILDHPDVTR